MNFGKIINYFKREELLYFRERLVKDYLRYAYPIAIAIIGRIYAERLDKSGAAEAAHFTRVSQCAKSEEGKIVGLLHDVVEDDYIDFRDLLLLGFSPDIIITLQILCHNKLKYPNYEDYITSIINSRNRLAIEIKLYDICDNLSPRRVILLSEKRKEKAVHKYCEALLRIAKSYDKIQKKEIYQKRRKIV